MPFESLTCDGFSRRSFLRLAGSLPVRSGLPVGTASAAAPVKAKSVIFIFLWVRRAIWIRAIPSLTPPPSIADRLASFPRTRPASSSASCYRVLPAAAIVFRSWHARHHGAGASRRGHSALTGFPNLPARGTNFGSIVARARGDQRGLPPFFSIARGVVMDGSRRIEGYGGGTLSQAYDPFLVGCTQSGDVEFPALELLEGLNPLAFRTAPVVTQLDAAMRRVDPDGPRAWSRKVQSAYDLLLDPAARQAFDLTRESDATRARYGFTTFGQSSLLARRLVEAGGAVCAIELQPARRGAESGV